MTDLTTKFFKIPKDDLDAFLAAVYNNSGDIINTPAYKSVFEHIFNNFTKAAEAGWGKPFSQFENKAEWELIQRLQQNLSHFTAGKIHSYIDELQRHLIKDGVKTDRAAWLKKASNVSRRQLNTWRKTEERTITQVSNSARRWEELVRRSFLYPNLKYITAGDERVRESHAAINGAVYPIGHVFWTLYYPPNGWNCRCKVLSSDEAVLEKAIDESKVPKAFRNNPGMSGKLFSDDHPYFSMSEIDKNKLNTKAELLQADTQFKQIKEGIEGKTFGFQNQQVSISKTMVNNVYRHYHRRPAFKLNLLNIIEKLSYLKHETAPATAGKPYIKLYHYYLIEILSEQFWLNIEEHKNGKVVLYAITDKIKKTTS